MKKLSSSSCSSGSSGGNGGGGALRGHWKPCEDMKLQELVSLYGPQNWNLIAQKLQGRSGNPLLSSISPSLVLHKFTYLQSFLTK